MRYKNPGDIISGALDVRDRIRTHDLLVRSQTLYPAELRTHFVTTKCILLLEALNVKYFFVN